MSSIMNYANLAIGVVTLFGISLLLQIINKTTF